MTDYLDDLIDQADLENGLTSVVEMKTGNDFRSDRLRWTENDDQFLRDNHDRLSVDEISEALGRSPAAIKIRRYRDLKLPSPTRHPDYITLSKASKLLGMNEPRKLRALLKSGVIKGEIINTWDHRTCRMRKPDFVEWIQQPESWLYFDPEKIKDPNIKKIVDRARVNWPDEYMSSRQIADYFDIDMRSVNRVFRLGRIKSALQIRNLSGRHVSPRWGLWFALRSEIESLDKRAVFRCRKWD